MTLSTHFDITGLRAPLIGKLESCLDLSERERTYLQELQADFLRVHDGHDIVTAGHSCRSFFVLNRGMAIRYKVLHDGRRQVLGLVLPGELIGFPGGLSDSSLYSIASL